MSYAISAFVPKFKDVIPLVVPVRLPIVSQKQSLFLGFSYNAATFIDTTDFLTFTAFATACGAILRLLRTPMEIFQWNGVPIVF